MPLPGGRAAPPRRDPHPFPDQNRDRPCTATGTRSSAGPPNRPARLQNRSTRPGDPGPDLRKTVGRSPRPRDAARRVRAPASSPTPSVRAASTAVCPRRERHPVRDRRRWTPETPPLSSLVRSSVSSRRHGTGARPAVSGGRDRCPRRRVPAGSRREGKWSALHRREYGDAPSFVRSCNEARLPAPYEARDRTRQAPAVAA